MLDNVRYFPISNERNDKKAVTFLQPFKIVHHFDQFSTVKVQQAGDGVVDHHQGVLGPGHDGGALPGPRLADQHELLPVHNESAWIFSVNKKK